MGIASCPVEDLDGDGIEDLALGGASIRCGGCEGSVAQVSGKDLSVLRVVLRKHMQD